MRLRSSRCVNLEALRFPPTCPTSRAVNFFSSDFFVGFFFAIMSIVKA
jgi:hypothetical protein